MEVEGGDGSRDSQQDFLGIGADFHDQNQTIMPGWGVKSHTCVLCMCVRIWLRGAIVCNRTRQQTM